MAMKKRRTTRITIALTEPEKEFIAVEMQKRHPYVELAAAVRAELLKRLGYK